MREDVYDHSEAADNPGSCFKILNLVSPAKSLLEGKTSYSKVLWIKTGTTLGDTIGPTTLTYSQHLPNYKAGTLSVHGLAWVR